MESLVSATAEGAADDVSWFETLYANHYDDLLRFAARRVGLGSAPDVVADVFMIAWRRRASVNRESDRLWLFGVARNVVANTLRSEDRRSQLTEQLGSDPALRLGASEPMNDHERVIDVLKTLPPSEREALLLTEWEQLDIGDAASVAGCSRATFRVRLHRARRKIAVRLEQAGATLDADGQGDTP